MLELVKGENMIYLFCSANNQRGNQMFALRTQRQRTIQARADLCTRFSRTQWTSHAIV